MHIHAAAEPIVTQFGRAVVAVESGVHGMLGRADVVAAGVAVHFNFRRRGELRARRRRELIRTKPRVPTPGRCSSSSG